MESQNQQILNHLKAGQSITALEALQNYECFRLAARIHDLKSDGWPVHCERTETFTGKRIALYSLAMNRSHWPKENGSDR